MNINSERKLKRNPKKSAETLGQKIEGAEKKRNKLRAAALREAVTVSPAEGLSAPYTAVGLVLRALTLFIGILGLNLFLFDALKVVILNSARADNITIQVSSVVLWSAICAAYVMLLSLTKVTRILAPIITAGGAAAYIKFERVKYFVINPNDFRCKIARVYI